VDSEGIDSVDERLLGKPSSKRFVEERGDGYEKDGMSSGFTKWKIQMGKLFVPKWRRTVILMWMIWGSMSFCT